MTRLELIEKYIDQSKRTYTVGADQEFIDNLITYEFITLLSYGFSLKDYKKKVNEIINDLSEYQVSKLITRIEID